MPAVRDVPSLLARLDAVDPGRPRLTWYAADGERVELSGHVLVNWVAKTANLLVEECDAGPGTLVALDLPPHWRTVVWALATWSVGAQLSPAGRPGDVLVTTSPPLAPARGPVVAVSLPALARRFEGAGAFDVDDAAEVSTFADSYDPAGPLDHDDLLVTARTAASARGWAEGVRLLVGPAAFDLVATVLAPLLLDGSVVLTEVLAPAPVSRLAAQEQVTATA